MRRLPIGLADVRADIMRDRRTLRAAPAPRLRCTLLNFFGGNRVGGPILSLDRCALEFRLPRNGDRDDVLGDKRFFERYDEELVSKRP